MTSLTFPKLYIIEVQLSGLRLKRLLVLGKVLSFFRLAIKVEKPELTMLKAQFEAMAVSSVVEYTVRQSMYGTGVVKVFRYGGIKVITNHKYIHPLRRKQ